MSKFFRPSNFEGEYLQACSAARDANAKLEIELANECCIICKIPTNEIQFHTAWGTGRVCTDCQSRIKSSQPYRDALSRLIKCCENAPDRGPSDEEIELAKSALKMTSPGRSTFISDGSQSKSKEPIEKASQ